MDREVTSYLIKYDLSLGSGSAAIACAQAGAQCSGVCANEKHQKWLNGLLDIAILAVASDVPPKATKGELEFPAKIKQHFGTAVAEAKRMLREEDADATQVDDDSSSDDSSTL